VIDVAALLRLARWFGARYGGQPKREAEEGSPNSGGPASGLANLGIDAKASPNPGHEALQRSGRAERSVQEAAREGGEGGEG